MVSPLQDGDILTSTISFYTLFNNPSGAGENCFVYEHIKVLYEVTNDGAVSDLFCGINPKIIYAPYFYRVT